MTCKNLARQRISSSKGSIKPGKTKTCLESTYIYPVIILASFDGYSICYAFGITFYLAEHENIPFGMKSNSEF